MNGRLAGFSLERLIQFLNILVRDVQIVVSQKKPHQEESRLTGYLSLILTEVILEITVWRMTVNRQLEGGCQPTSLS